MRASTGCRACASVPSTVRARRASRGARVCARAARRSVRACRSADDDDVSTPTPDMFGSGTSRVPPLHRAARWGDRARVLALLSEPDAPTWTRLTRQHGDDVGGAVRSRRRRRRCRETALSLTRNRFGWSALEYAPRPTSPATSSPSFSPPPASPAARVVVPPRMLAGAHGALVCDHAVDARRSGPAIVGAAASRIVGAAERYAESAARSAATALENPAEMVVGGVAVAGCTFKPLDSTRVSGAS